MTPIVYPQTTDDKSKASPSLKLICSYEVEDTVNFEVQFIVTWFKVMRFMGGRSGRLVLLRHKTSLKIASLDFDAVDLSLGDTVR